MTSPLPPFDRLVAKETALGAIREMPIPSAHIGLREIAPFEEVESDDVIFDFIEQVAQEGLAPARAQDAESELAQKDDYGVTSGRARLIDWSLKNTYDSSKVMAYKDRLRVQAALEGLSSVNLTTRVFDAPIVEFRNKIARDDAFRKSRLDNRLEWLIMTALETSKLAYVDGKINFAIDYKRPAGQQDVPTSVYWDDPTADPINDIIAMNRYMGDTYGIEMKEAYCSKYALRDLWKLNNFRVAASVGLLVPNGVTTAVGQVPYINPGYNEASAIRLLEDATGVTFKPYDGLYRSRPIGSTTTTNVRYTSSNKIIFKPSAADLAEVDPDGIGFAKTLTSPHAEGNWTPGFYEWEKDHTDPWGTDRGTGIKAFPIFPFMKYSYVMKVRASATAPTVY